VASRSVSLAWSSTSPMIVGRALVNGTDRYFDGEILDPAAFQGVAGHRPDRRGRWLNLSVGVRRLVVTTRRNRSGVAEQTGYGGRGSPPRSRSCVASLNR
jgi:hypothetical protein